MRNINTSNHVRVSHAALLSIALSIVGMPMMAMAQDVTAAAAVDNKTTAYEESATPVTDTWITTKVKAELLANETVKGLDINVSTVNGVVTLAGVLDSKAQVETAISVTKGIKGVTRVDTKALKIKPAK
ncbi:MAG TPA: BON domain-containing protein [Arenimonas sp.]|uniref:BON domain-containing protein n=1 Tax=Arenimonas sp. TaxID=1872635 RepID=UPI002BC2759B|nr:BON domain-containing protein [Arenimonas sp.]HMB55692.1 BON domain-containing protein [Arenimonas sp.]